MKNIILALAVVACMALPALACPVGVAGGVVVSSSVSFGGQQFGSYGTPSGLVFAPQAFNGVHVVGSPVVVSPFVVQHHRPFVVVNPVVVGRPVVVANGGVANGGVVVNANDVVTFARTGPFGVTRSTTAGGNFTRTGPLGASTTFTPQGTRIFTGPAGRIRGIR